MNYKTALKIVKTESAELVAKRIVELYEVIEELTIKEIKKSSKQRAKILKERGE